MNRVSINIAGFILIAWIVALLLNLDIYRKANIELSVFGPITDAIILMLIALISYLGVAIYSTKTEGTTKWVNAGLLGLGILVVIMISFFYIATFR